MSGAATDGAHGAWGSFTFLGRVRPWDGLAVVLRTPVSARALSAVWGWC